MEKTITPTMEELIAILHDCALFDGLTDPDIKRICQEATFFRRNFGRDEIVAFEEDPCQSIGIVISGSIHIQRLFSSGKTITLETFYRSDSFGEALLFADQSDYPATLVAREETQVLYIDKQAILDLCNRYPVFMSNILRALSNKILLLNRKIKSLTYTSIRQKVSNHLLEEARRQNSLTLDLPINRSELADFLGIPRPSLSRELVMMKDDGWIEFERNLVKIINVPALKKALGR